MEIMTWRGAWVRPCTAMSAWAMSVYTLKICILTARAHVQERRWSCSKWCIWKRKTLSHPHAPLLLLLPSSSSSLSPSPCTSSPVLCKLRCTAIFEGGWCHKWFEQWAYNCWSRFVWQSGKLSTAPSTDQDPANAQQQNVSVLSSLWVSFCLAAVQILAWSQLSQVWMWCFL